MHGVSSDDEEASQEHDRISLKKKGGCSMARKCYSLILIALALVLSSSTSPSQAQALRGLSTNSAGPIESSTICGSFVPAPRALPPTGSGPVVFYISPCIEGPGSQSPTAAETYLKDIQLRPSRPTQGLWPPYDATAERMIFEDFQRLWSHHALDDLSVEIRDYRFSNGVIGKLVTYKIQERN
jgi:hypothetical protein